MKKRIITAIIAVIGVFPIFWFSAPIEPSHPLHYLYPLFFCVVALFSMWEMLNCLQLTKRYAISIPMYLAALAFPMLARVMMGNMREYVRIAVFAALVLAIYLFGYIVFCFGKIELSRVTMLFMTGFYIIAANSGAVILRDMEGVGDYLFLVPFVLSWTTDIFAYFTGRLFGKHKLIESVSPKKTVEGAIGGLVFCSLVAMLYGFIVSRIFPVTPNYLVLAVGGILIGVVSQIGDLVMSAIKREYGIKDYGFVLPGHGGALDRFDSSMAVTVLVLIIAQYFPLFTV